MMPIEMNKIQKGWVRKNFKGTPAEFRVAYRKQLTLLLVIGLVFVCHEHWSRRRRRACRARTT